MIKLNYYVTKSELAKLVGYDNSRQLRNQVRILCSDSSVNITMRKYKSFRLLPPKLSNLIINELHG